MKKKTKKILTPEEITTVKAAAKILKKLQKKVDRMSSYDNSTELWLEDLYVEAHIDICDGMLYIDIAS